MAVVHKVYPQAIKNIFNGDSNIVTGVVKVALLNATAYNAAHETWSQVSAGEIGSADYTVGGEILAIGTANITVAAEVVTVDTADAETVFTVTGSISATQAVIYNSTSGDLISHIDFGATEESVDGEWKITWNAAGLFTITVNAA